MPILNGSGTYIRFVNGKMGRKISEGNAANVAAQKITYWNPHP